MTAVADSPAISPVPPADLPGWNIAANVMPSEVMAARRAQIVLRGMAVLLAVVLLLCAAGYWMAHGKASKAASNLASEQLRTSQLQAAQAKYAPITRIKADTLSAQQQLAQLMSNDASLAPLLATLQSRLPAGGTIQQVTVALSGSSSQSTTGGTLVTTTEKQIGTITFSGSMPSAAAATGFVQNLTATPIKGLLLPYPGSTTVGADGRAQYSISATLTAALLTHQYDVKGSK